MMFQADKGRESVLTENGIREQNMRVQRDVEETQVPRHLEHMPRALEKRIREGQVGTPGVWVLNLWPGTLG